MDVGEKQKPFLPLIEPEVTHTYGAFPPGLFLSSR